MVADETAVAHEPAESAFYDPSMGEELEALVRVGAFDDLDLEFRTEAAHPVGELLSGVAAIDPQLPQPREPEQQRSEQQHSAGPFRGAGRGGLDPEEQSHGVHQDVAFAAL